MFLRVASSTGLDPAGPKFASYPPEVRLSPDDAEFVDAIHSMGKEGFVMDFGTLVPVGHADFYPNGGGVQPGCSNYQADQQDMLQLSRYREVLGSQYGGIRSIGLFSDEHG